MGPNFFKEMSVDGVTAQFLPVMLDANLCKNKQKQTNRTNTITDCANDGSFGSVQFVHVGCRQHIAVHTCSRSWF